MELIILLLMIASLIAGLALWNRLGRRLAGYMTVISLTGIGLSIGFYLWIITFGIAGIHPYLVALGSAILLVFSLYLLPIRLLGLTGNPKSGQDSTNRSN